LGPSLLPHLGFFPIRIIKTQIINCKKKRRKKEKEKENLLIK
jgi:hypothetical protein